MERPLVIPIPNRPVRGLSRASYPALFSTHKHRLYPLGLSITGAVDIMNGLLGKASCASYPPAMRAPFVYRVTAVCVFLMGFALHLTNVVIGPDRLVAKVFSPRVEIVFAVMMIVAAISGWMSLKRLSSRGLLRVVYWFALILITLSIPIHVRSLVIWSTAWVHAFPKYYSHVETPMFLALAYAVTRFRFR